MSWRGFQGGSGNFGEMRWWPQEDEYVISTYIYIYILLCSTQIKMYRLEYDNLTNIFIILALTWNGFIPRSWLVASPFFFGVFQRLWLLVEVWLSSVPRQQPDLSTFQRLCWNPHGGWLFRLGRPLRAGKHRAIPRWSVRSRRFRPSHGGTHCRSFGFGVGGGAQEWMQFFKGQI